MIEPGRFKELLRESFGKVLGPFHLDTVYAGWDVTGWGDRTKALVTVVSPNFEGMADGRRQELVWEAVLSDLDNEGLDQIEFIFTKAPSELKEHDPRRIPAQPAGSNMPGDHG